MVTIECDEARGVDFEGDITYHVTFESIDSYVKRMNDFNHTFLFLSSHLIARCLHASNVRYATQRNRVPNAAYNTASSVRVCLGACHTFDAWIDVHGGLVW